MNEYAPYCTVEQACELIACSLQKNIPFYACRYPQETVCRFGAQSVGRPLDGVGDGFRVVPFDVQGDAKAFTIQPDLFACDIDRLRAISPHNVTPRFFTDEDMSQDEYLLSAKALVERMQVGNMQKVVLSRTITRHCDTMTFLPRYFARLCKLYPTAFLFIVAYPGVCGWVGASPEVLLQSHAAGYETMALAGTRMIGSEQNWGEKEVAEQRYVSRYVSEILCRQGFKDVKSHTYTRQAAQVEHLCTHFDISSRLSVSVRDKLVADLHPTPAVAGTPTDTAMQAIRATERHNRRYYGGYVGEALSDGRCRLFVNLRSMEFMPTAVRLYVGGGLTAQSLPSDEWNETCAKSQTLLSAFQ